MQSISRRLFLEDSMLTAAAIAASLAPQAIGAEEKTTGVPSNRVRVAVLGCRIRGKQHVAELAKIPDCEMEGGSASDQRRASSQKPSVVLM